ncbi:MAG: cysteine desulfurase [candidate division KSB1 bacterium]|nr:cysteine desulfurase [candidate division KSB1 bacterium]MDQ7066042.1 cysteine desulfurase [candidate division KSB1 bacterium]
MIDLSRYRKDFPILNQTVKGRPLIYLDNAATAQKPLQVIGTVDQYYREYNSNVHRGLHTLSERATRAYEKAREKVARFIHAPRSEEVIFTRNTTESINLVAYTWARKFLKAGDAILLTEMEHHSNLVPWHLLREEKSIELRFIPVTPRGELDLQHLKQLLDGVRLVSVTHMSNVLGTINPVEVITEEAHAAGAKVLIDGAQAVPHMPVNVQDIDCDFYAFSGHKMCGPTGVGVLWARAEILRDMPPFLGGGEMIHEVHLNHSDYADIPNKFEAGTPNIAQAIGLGAAVDYLSRVGMENILQHEQEIGALAIEKLKSIKGLRIFGESEKRGAAISFEIEGVHPHDIATILDEQGIAIRAGHHCAQPLMRKFNVQSTARASFYFYNVPEEIDILVDALKTAKRLFGYVT